MAPFSARRLPRGINFLLGGTVVAIGFVVFALVGGGFGFKVGTAPAVRIDQPMVASED